MLWLILLAVVALNINLYQVIPKGFFPQQDTGRIFGAIRADQATSFQSMQQRLDRFIEVVRSDPAVQDVTGYTGGYQRNSAWMSISLKPRGEREASADQVVARLRTQLAREPGARLFMVPGQDLRFGARTSSSQFEYTVKADDLEDLKIWGPRIRSALMRLKEIEDISTEFEDRGLQTALVIDREAVARLGLSMRDISTALQNAYGQRQIGVIYNPLNQYHVVMEVAPEYWENPERLKDIYVSTTGGSISGAQATAAVGVTGSPSSTPRIATLMGRPPTFEARSPGQVAAGITVPEVPTDDSIQKTANRPENQAAAPGAKLPKVAVATVSGAPSDGNRQLQSGMRRALGSNKIVVTDKPGDEAYSVSASVSLTAMDDRMTQLSISWVLRDAAGKEIGKVDQSNPVPVAATKGTWAGFGDIVAMAAVEGILELIEKANSRPR